MPLISQGTNYCSLQTRLADLPPLWTPVAVAEPEMVVHQTSDTRHQTSDTRHQTLWTLVVMELPQDELLHQT